LVVIYPVVELNDLIYAHWYGWLQALTSVTEGVMLRPESPLGKAFRCGLPIKSYLSQYGLPVRALNCLKVLLDHGIGSSSFTKAFGLEKTPRNLVYVYRRLGVDMGAAFDVPAKLYISVVADLVIRGATKVEIDPAVESVVRELANAVRDELKGRVDEKGRRRTLETIERHNTFRGLLKELSMRSVETTIERLKEMIEHAERLGFKGLVPVIQGLFDDDIEYCARQSIEIAAQASEDFTVAIGTGGRILSDDDVERIRLAIRTVKRCASRHNVSVKIHLFGWSSPNRLRDREIVRDIHSADSLTVRRRAVEGKIYVAESDRLKLIHVSDLRGEGYRCECPACQDPVLMSYVLDPSGARRNDVRMIHNIYVIASYFNRLKKEASAVVI
jgi:sugar phosphate isomerase/epimerase